MDFDPGARSAGPGAAGPKGPQDPVEELAAANENPIMRAAVAVLLLHSVGCEWRLLRAPLASLRSRVANAIRGFFEKDIRLGGVHTSRRRQPTSPIHSMCPQPTIMSEHPKPRIGKSRTKTAVTRLLRRSASAA